MKQNTGEILFIYTIFGIIGKWDGLGIDLVVWEIIWDRNYQHGFLDALSAVHLTRPLAGIIF